LIIVQESELDPVVSLFSILGALALGSNGAAPSSGARRTLLLALATQFSNPKTLIVISGILAALLPSVVPKWMYIAIPLISLLIDTGWYAFVAIAMSSATPRLAYLRAKTTIDRTVGGVLGALGLRLIFEGAKEAA
jgi:threonine/homoserine/homoserine lactone efflux protein